MTYALVALVLVVVLAGALLRRVVVLGWELSLAREAARSANAWAVQQVENGAASEAELVELLERTSLLTRRNQEISTSEMRVRDVLDLLLEAGNVSQEHVDGAVYAAGYTAHRAEGVSRRAIRALEGGPLFDSAVMVGDDDAADDADVRNGDRRPCTASQALNSAEAPGPPLDGGEDMKMTMFLGSDRAANLSLHELAALEGDL